MYAQLPKSRGYRTRLQTHFCSPPQYCSSRQIHADTAKFTVAALLLPTACTRRRDHALPAKKKQQQHAVAADPGIAIVSHADTARFMQLPPNTSAVTAGHMLTQALSRGVAGSPRSIPRITLSPQRSVSQCRIYTFTPVPSQIHVVAVVIQAAARAKST